MCFLAFILREVKEGAGLLESQCTFSFEGVGGDFSWDNLLLGGDSW